MFWTKILTQNYLLYLLYLNICFYKETCKWVWPNLLGTKQVVHASSILFVYCFSGIESILLVVPRLILGGGSVLFGFISVTN